MVLLGKASMTTKTNSIYLFKYINNPNDISKCLGDLVVSKISNDIQKYASGVFPDFSNPSSPTSYRVIVDSEINKEDDSKKKISKMIYDVQEETN